MSRLDEILAELDRIQERLADLPEDAFDAKAQLQSRQADLRSEAARLREESPVPNEDLVDRLNRLEARWEQLRKERINLISQAGGGSEGGDFGFVSDAAEINRQIDEANDLQELETEIADIRRRLRERGVDPDG